jgi:cytochrome c-type biogenesis protein
MAVRFVLAVIGGIVLATVLAAQQSPLPDAHAGLPHSAHSGAGHAGRQSAPAPSSSEGGHAFTLNVYVSDSGVDPSVVFVPVGRRVQLALRNLSMSEHHYRVVELSASDLLWVSEPGSGSEPLAEPSDDDHMHHARGFVPLRAASPAGIRPTGHEVHAYVSAARIVDILIFTATQTGRFAIQCDLHQETIGKMVVFDAGEPSAVAGDAHTDAPGNVHGSASGSAPASPLIFEPPNPLRLELTRDLGSVDHPGTSGVRVEATYAPPDQLARILGGPAPTMRALEGDRHVAFLLTETVHEGGLPGAAESPHVYIGENHLPLIDSKIVTESPQRRVTLYRFGWDGALGTAEPVVTLRLTSGQEASWDLPSPKGRYWLAWLAVAGCLGFVGWLAWTVRQDSRKGSNRLRWARATALILLGFVAAWSWLFVVSRWGPEQRTDILTFKSGVTSKVMRALLKPAQGGDSHNHEATSVSGVYATPEYYLMTEQTQEAAKYEPDQFNVFYLFEDSHIGGLGSSPPAMALRLADGREFSPLDTTLLSNSAHHRAAVFRFPHEDPQGRLLISDQAPFFELVAQESTGSGGGVVHAAMMGSAPMMPMSAAQVMRWDLPIVYPKDLTGSDLSLPTLFALLAGLLAVLSPCLLQLTVYYTFALAGIGMQQDLVGSNIAEARSQVIRTALQFIAGFTIVFTAAGSLAGLAGQKLQVSGLMEEWNRPLGIAAGLGLLIVGVWVGSNAGAPGLCRLPLSTALRKRRPWLDRLKVMFMGSAFAVGCSTCFGGALFISLMIYVGAAGSPWLGAISLFLFSLGIAVPYLLAAFFLSRALPLLNSLHKAASVVGLVCSIVLISFGVILITDNFHVPSNALYRLYLGL